MIPTEQENPDGLNQRYIVTKANGEPCDPRAIYFVLRLDSHGDDPLHIEACRWAARMWAENAPSHLRKVAKELLTLLDSLKPKAKKPEDNPGVPTDQYQVNPGQL